MSWELECTGCPTEPLSNWKFVNKYIIIVLGPPNFAGGGVSQTNNKLKNQNPNCIVNISQFSSMIIFLERISIEPETLPFPVQRILTAVLGLSSCVGIFFFLSYSACALLFHLQCVHHRTPAQSHCYICPPWSEDRVPYTPAWEEWMWKHTDNGALMCTLNADFSLFE